KVFEHRPQRVVLDRVPLGGGGDPPKRQRRFSFNQGGFERYADTIGEADEVLSIRGEAAMPIGRGPAGLDPLALKSKIDLQQGGSGRRQGANETRGNLVRLGRVEQLG